MTSELDLDVDTLTRDIMSILTHKSAVSLTAMHNIIRVSRDILLPDLLDLARKLEEESYVVLTDVNGVLTIRLTPLGWLKFSKGCTNCDD